MKKGVELSFCCSDPKNLFGGTSFEEIIYKEVKEMVSINNDFAELYELINREHDFQQTIFNIFTFEITMDINIAEKINRFESVFNGFESDTKYGKILLAVIESLQVDFILKHKTHFKDSILLHFEVSMNGNEYNVIKNLMNGNYY